MRGSPGGRDVRHDVAEAVVADLVVAAPAVGADLGPALDVVEHEVGQHVLAGVRDPPHAHAAGIPEAVVHCVAAYSAFREGQFVQASRECVAIQYPDHAFWGILAHAGSVE